MKRTVQGATILTITSFIAKILAAMYRVPYQNLVGDAGFYVYQQVYPIYGIAMTLALTGLPMFISKMVVEHETAEEQKVVLRKLFVYITIMSVFLWIGTFFGSEVIAHFMGNAKLQPLIQVSSLSFLLIPPLAILRGTFQGNLYMMPTGVSQVVEQFLRVSIIWLAAYSFAYYGWSIYHTGTVAMSGALVGGLAALVVLLFYNRKAPVVPNFFAMNKVKVSGKNILKRLIFEGGTLSIYSGLLVLMQLVDSFTLKNALVRIGFSETEAQITKGIYDRGQPLVQLGLVIALALSSSFLPTLTKNFVERNKKFFKENVELYLKLTITFSSAATVGLILLLPYVNYTLFEDDKLNAVLSVYLVAIFLMALIQAYQSIFQSKNQFRYPIFAAAVGILLKVLLTYTLTVHFKEFGGSLSTVISLCVTLLLLYFHGKMYKVRFSFLGKIGGSLIGMSLVLFIYHWLVPVNSSRLMTLLLAILGVVLGVIAFVSSLLLFKVYSKGEWLAIPFGKKIVKWFK